MNVQRFRGSGHGGGAATHPPGTGAGRGDYVDADTAGRRAGQAPAPAADSGGHRGPAACRTHRPRSPRRHPSCHPSCHRRRHRRCRLQAWERQHVRPPRRSPMPVPSVIPSLAERFLQDTGVGVAGSGVTSSGVAGSGQYGPAPARTRSTDRLEISGEARLAAQQAQQGQPAAAAPIAARAMQMSASASAQAAVASTREASCTGASGAVAQELHALRVEIAQLRRLVGDAGAGADRAGLRATRTQPRNVPPVGTSGGGPGVTGAAADGRCVGTVPGTSGDPGPEHAGAGDERGGGAGGRAARTAVAAYRARDGRAASDGPAGGGVRGGPLRAGKTLAAVKLARHCSKAGGTWCW